MNLPRGKLIALVAIIAAVGIVTATGAFTTVSAERVATVSVSGDEGALLGLSPIDYDDDGNIDDEIASLDNNQLNIELTNVNLNATTTFAKVFQIQNNGQNEVAVNISNFDYDDGNFGTDESSYDHENAVNFVVYEDQLSGSLPTGLTTYAIAGQSTAVSLNEIAVDLEPGESVEVGVHIDTTAYPDLDPDASDANLQDILDAVSITADSTAADSDDQSQAGDNLDASQSS